MLLYTDKCKLAIMPYSAKEDQADRNPNLGEYEKNGLQLITYYAINSGLDWLGICKFRCLLVL